MSKHPYVWFKSVFIITHRFWCCPASGHSFGVFFWRQLGSIIISQEISNIYPKQTIIFSPDITKHVYSLFSSLSHMHTPWQKFAKYTDMLYNITITIILSYLPSEGWLYWPSNSLSLVFTNWFHLLFYVVHPRSLLLPCSFFPFIMVFIMSPDMIKIFLTEYLVITSISIKRSVIINLIFMQ